jgi:hypothetical protein
MAGHDATPQPVLADAVLSPAPPPRGAGSASAALLAAAGLLAGFWLLAPASSGLRAHVPAGPSDLGAGMITLVDRADRDAVQAAVAALDLPAARRRQIEADVLAGERRIGWIVVTDSMDPDGDTIAVRSGGLSQLVVLDKSWMPVPVLLDQTGMVSLLAVKDGDSGGITLALVTRGGQVPLRPLAPGEHIEVAAP